MEKMVSIGVFMKVVSIVSSPSFVCLSVSCLSYSLDVAGHAFKNKTDKILNNQGKSAQALADRLWLNTPDGCCLEL